MPLSASLCSHAGRQVPGDKSAFIPGGIRVGTPALTSRGFEEAHFEQVAEFIHRGVAIAKDVNASGIGKKLADFKAALKAKEWPEITALKDDVEAFSSQVRLAWVAICFRCVCHLVAACDCHPTASDCL